MHDFGRGTLHLPVSIASTFALEALLACTDSACVASAGIFGRRGSFVLPPEQTHNVFSVACGPPLSQAAPRELDRSRAPRLTTSGDAVFSVARAVCGFRSVLRNCFSRPKRVCKDKVVSTRISSVGSVLLSLELS